MIITAPSMLKTNVVPIARTIESRLSDNASAESEASVFDAPVTSAAFVPLEPVVVDGEEP